MNNFTMVPQNRDTGKENREITLSLMLGETKSEYPKWRRELEYKASLAGLTQMINEPRKILLTREQWGSPPKPQSWGGTQRIREDRAAGRREGM
jgi:hypothetical protein